MKKPEWLFVIALLLVGAYFSYRYFGKKEQFNPLQLVPNSAALVYEANDPFGLYEHVKSTDLWEALLGIKAVDGAQNALDVADSIFKVDQRLSTALQLSVSLASVHVTGNESSGLMLYLPTGPGTTDILEEVSKKVHGAGVTTETRLYDGYTISEIQSGDWSLTYIFYQNYIVMSTYGFLIEDVVRNINKGFESGFFVDYANLYSVPKLGDDAGNIYLNGKQLTAMANTLLPPKASIGKLLAESGYLDISVSSSKLFFSGFLYDNAETGLVSIFNNQDAGRPESVNLISENAAEAMIINVSDIGEWHKRWIEKYTYDNRSDNGLIPFLKGDIAVSSFFNNSELNDRMILARLADKEGALNLLNRKAEEIALAKKDTVYYEQYADLNIGLIEESEYPALVFGTPFLGFENTYFTVYDDFLVLAPTVERIKRWLEDIDNDLIWSRSIEKRGFIESNLNETSFAMVYTNPWGWSLIRDGLNESFGKWWKVNEEQVKQFGLLSFQFANLDKRYYAEIKLEYNPQQVYVAQQEFADEQLTQLTGRLIVKPKLVKNHNNSDWEVLIQDSAAYISLLDDKGELLWTDSLGEKIISEIYQVDFYKNRKLQYLFATDSALHIIDRNGVEIEGYPISTKGARVKELFLLDYDRSRNYRFLVSDYSGNLHLYNMEGEQLEGWNPLAINSELSDQVFHVRVRGNDRIVIGQKNGTVELRNRRGEIQDGFPLDLEFNLLNPLHFKAASTFASSRFTALSSEGILVEFDLNGKEYSRRQIGEPSSSAKFSMAIDKSRNDLVVARQDINRLTILDNDGKTIFEKDYESANALDVQYYYLGVDKLLYIVRDKVTGRLYLYNKAGALVNETALFSDYPVSVVYRKKEAKCYIYAANNQSVEIKSFTF